MSEGILRIQKAIVATPILCPYYLHHADKLTARDFTDSDLWHGLEVLRKLKDAEKITLLTFILAMEHEYPYAKWAVWADELLNYAACELGIYKTYVKRLKEETILRKVLK